MDASEDSLFLLTTDECERLMLHSSSSLSIDRPCTLGDGIEWWDKTQLNDWILKWQESPLSPSECSLWIPASGAATRMFSPLLSDPVVQTKMYDNVDHFAFGKAWREAVSREFDSWESASPKQSSKLLWSMMDDGQLPKALVPFHIDPDSKQIETACLSHIRMWSEVMKEGGDVFFTVQSSKRVLMASHLAEVKGGNFQFHFPEQDPNTDLPVLGEDGCWMRNVEGQLLRRPGGHGALLPLLEKVQTRFVVIRNIDNAPSPGMRHERVEWTCAMIAAARDWAKERDEAIHRLQREESDLPEVLAWLESSGAGNVGSSIEMTADDCLELLARPMRLVGVVKNEGQPGGGPFWAKNLEGKDGARLRPQIIESVEFTSESEKVMVDATHFNPVDMVCIMNPGQALAPFVDASRYLRSEKAVNGQPSKVLEHPGLWNGGMSGWLTRFVQIPSSCFQPVKTALDLMARH